MQRNTLTLKSISKVVQSQITPATSVCIQAGRKPKTGPNKASTALLNLLKEMVDSRSKVFIQMRHGAGYCGIPVQIEDGWLTMEQVSKELWPFYGAMCLALLLVTYVPAISLWLPGLMK